MSSHLNRQYYYGREISSLGVDKKANAVLKPKDKLLWVRRLNFIGLPLKYGSIGFPLKYGSHT